MCSDSYVAALAKSREGCASPLNALQLLFNSSALAHYSSRQTWYGWMNEPSDKYEGSIEPGFSIATLFGVLGCIMSNAQRLLVWWPYF